MRHEWNRADRVAGGYAALAMQGRDVVAGRARQGNWQKYLREVDPDGVLPEAERVRRAEDLQRARMMVLGKKSAEVRKRKKEAAVNARIRAIANPPAACALCGPVPAGATHRTCEEHARDMDTYHSTRARV